MIVAVIGISDGIWSKAKLLLTRTQEEWAEAIKEAMHKQKGGI